MNQEHGPESHPRSRFLNCAPTEGRQQVQAQVTGSRKLPVTRVRTTATPASVWSHRSSPLNQGSIQNPSSQGLSHPSFTLRIGCSTPSEICSQTEGNERWRDVAGQVTRETACATW